MFLANREVPGNDIGVENFAICDDHCRENAPYGIACTQCIQDMSCYLEKTSRYTMIYDAKRKRYLPLMPYIEEVGRQLLINN